MLEALPEQAVTAFEDGNPEYVLVSAQRGLAVLLTQTCDLDASYIWLFCPAFSVAGSTVNRGNLFAGKYATLLGLYRHPDGYFEDSYIDLTDIRPVRKELVALADRVASMARDAQIELVDKVANTLTRRSGFDAGERVQKTGFYRCESCNNYREIENPEREFQEGHVFPHCENCSRIRKRSQWYLLVRHERS